jgi:hypothetical protein
MTPKIWFKARVRKEADGRLAITWRYREPNVGGGTMRIGPTEELFGVPFQQWERNIMGWWSRMLDLFGVPFQQWERYGGRTIDLMQWHGTEFGMIGGPKKMNRDMVMRCGWLGRIAYIPTESIGDGFSAGMVQQVSKEVRELEEELNDERFEFSPQERQKLEGWVTTGRAFLAKQENRSV